MVALCTMLRLSQIAVAYVRIRPLLRRREIHGGERTHVVWTLPPEAALQIMVAEYHVHQPIQYHFALWGSQAVDRTGLLGGVWSVDALKCKRNTYICPDGEDALPSGHGVCADDRVHCLHGGASVIRVATRVRVHFDVCVLDDFLEDCRETY